MIVEEWQSVEAHQKAATRVPREMISEVMDYLAGPPKGEYFVQSS
jgi:hypothetical protein